MHRGCGVRQLPVKVFVVVSSCVGIVVLKIVNMLIIVMNESTAVLFLRQEVKADVIPVSWPHLVIGVKSVAEILRHRHWKMLGLKQCHFSFKVLVLASIVLC